MEEFTVPQCCILYHRLVNGQLLPLPDYRKRMSNLTADRLPETLDLRKSNDGIICLQRVIGVDRRKNIPFVIAQWECKVVCHCGHILIAANNPTTIIIIKNKFGRTAD